MWQPRVLAIHAPGLFKATGNLSVTAGWFRPIIYVDPQIEGPGASAIMAHETCHAKRRHVLKGGLVLISGLAAVGVGVAYESVVACIAAPFSSLLWLFWVRFIEASADRYAIKVVGEPAYRAMLHRLRDRPSGWFNRWCYGPSRAVRYKRATGKELQ